MLVSAFVATFAFARVTKRIAYLVALAIGTGGTIPPLAFTLALGLAPLACSSGQRGLSPVRLSQGLGNAQPISVSEFPFQMTLYDIP